MKKFLSIFLFFLSAMLIACSDDSSSATESFPENAHYDVVFGQQLHIFSKDSTRSAIAAVKLTLDFKPDNTVHMIIRAANKVMEDNYTYIYEYTDGAADVYTITRQKETMMFFPNRPECSGPVAIDISNESVIVLATNTKDTERMLSIYQNSL